jgi:hypothetical protein
MDIKENKLMELQTVFIESVYFLDLKFHIATYDGNLAENISSALYFWFCEGISAI